MDEPLLKDLFEFVVPKPGMIIKDRKSGRHGKVGWFQWKGGTTEKIPVEFEDGTKDSVWVSAFNRRYDAIDPESGDYQQHLLQGKQSKELQALQTKFGEVQQIINGLEDHRKEFRTSLHLRQALDQQIADLKNYRDEILRDIRKLGKQ